MARTGQHVETGTLLTPNNTIDTTTGTISLKANFANKDDRLWPGQFVNMRVQVELCTTLSFSPSRLCSTDPTDCSSMWSGQIRPLARSTIQTGYQDDNKAVVTEGLSGKETVVMSGQSRLSPGMRVAATDASNRIPAQPRPPTARIS